MGVVRKTLSVGTLGLVSFRGKKEKLRRAERARSEAETSLRDEHENRVAAEAGLADAEKRSRRATKKAAKATKAAGAAAKHTRSKRGRRRRRKVSSEA